MCINIESNTYKYKMECPNFVFVLDYLSNKKMFVSKLSFNILNTNTKMK